MRPRAGLAAVVAMCWFWVVPIVDAATARAELKDARGTKVGDATLVDTPEGVKISARFTELPHGFHVHAVGRCEPPFESAGGHFNPITEQHGRDNPQGPHAGDLPNVRCRTGERERSKSCCAAGRSTAGRPVCSTATARASWFTNGPTTT